MYLASLRCQLAGEYSSIDQLQMLGRECFTEHHVGVERVVIGDGKLVRVKLKEFLQSSEALLQLGGQVRNASQVRKNFADLANR